VASGWLPGRASPNSELNLDTAVEQRRHEDAKAENKPMLAISPRSETCTWQVNPNPPRIYRFLAPFSRLRAFFVHIQLRIVG
jgi:hypothetical protein